MSRMIMKDYGYSDLPGFVSLALLCLFAWTAFWFTQRPQR